MRFGNPAAVVNGCRNERFDIMKVLVIGGGASDGFFPFDDCVTLAAEYGVTAIVQPGGSVRDEDSVRKANEKGIAMMFTGERHFKH